MPRNVEFHPYAVKPVHSRPGAGAKDAASAGKPFAQLLAEAEAVRDSVHIKAPAPAPVLKTARTVSGLVAAATGLWHGLGGSGRARRAREDAPETGPLEG